MTDTEFTLDPVLANDCHQLASLEYSELLLMDNQLVPWFILVPRSNHTELTDLTIADQHTVLDEINQIAGFVRTVYKVDKLNIAAIGNIVRQLHIHIVGRSETDYCWPNVVWGAQGKEPHTEQQIDTLRRQLKSYLRI